MEKIPSISHNTGFPPPITVTQCYRIAGTVERREENKEKGLDKRIKILNLPIKDKYYFKAKLKNIINNTKTFKEIWEQEF